MHLIMVDLPAPLSPTSAMISPARTSKSTSVRACTDPNDFVMFRSWRSGVAVMVAGRGFLPQNERRYQTDGGARQGASASFGPATSSAGVYVLAVLLVLADADVALLDELVRVELVDVGL